MSRKEVSYKLYSKGIQNSLIEDYFSDHAEELYAYELQSAKKVILKKQSTMEKEELKNHLRKKGYREEIIREAIEEE